MVIHTTSAFEAFGSLARTSAAPTEQAGRYPSQQEAESLIIEDVRKKLGLEPSHSLLEIGCGPGNLLIPLSFLVASATGMDHTSIIDKAKIRFDDPRVNWVSGEFPNYVFAEKFDRILTYSVIHYLNSMSEVIFFIESAAALLPPRGKLLIGDVPNKDRKQRFTESDYGNEFKLEWQRQNASAQFSYALNFEGSMRFLSDDDVLSILKYFRKTGFHADVLPQDPKLPFGNTREDILIARP